MLRRKTFIFLKGASGSGQKVRKFLVTKDALVWCKGDKFKGKYSLLNIDLLKSKPYQNGISYLYIKLKKEDRGRKILTLLACGPDGVGYSKKYDYFVCDNQDKLLELKKLLPQKLAK